MKWKKLGLLFCPPKLNAHPKLISHAANPLPIHMEGDVYRIFYSGRNANNQSSVGAVDIDIINRKIITEHKTPFFEHGPTGSFYADGVSIGNCYEVDGKKYMLFMGWQNDKATHWRGDIGRLIVHPDLSLTLDSEIPLMSIDRIDPVSLSYPWVEGNYTSGFKMWYGSTLTWDTGEGEMLHVIHHANSTNGHDWNRQGLAVPHQLGTAQAFSRPTLLENLGAGLDMWFSYRGSPGKKYRIGYASSTNKKTWKLELNKTGIDISETGWDSEMIEYPFVFSHKEQQYMLYNGNGYGQTGFGLAILTERK